MKLIVRKMINEGSDPNGYIDFIEDDAGGGFILGFYVNGVSVNLPVVNNEQLEILASTLLSVFSSVEMISIKREVMKMAMKNESET
jgi:hypothetical protein